VSSSHPLPPLCDRFSRLASALDPRSTPRLARLLLGAVLAAGRRTVASWIRAAGLIGEFRPRYTTVAAGGHADAIAARLAHAAVKPLMVWPDTGRRHRGTTGHGDRATPTSGGRDGGSCWPRKSTPFYATAGRKQKSGTRPNARSTWPRERNGVTEMQVG
jgi:hypothetical protein